MKNIKLVLSYDGTDFCGFQMQKNLRTVASELDKALSTINGKKINFTCSGRTDTGVHAEGQVINFYTEKENMSEFNWICALNSYLPRDIRVIDASFVPLEFNARRSTLFREYQYFIVNEKTISALWYRYASLYFYEELDIDLLQKYANNLLGENDFTSFCSVNDKNISKSRFIKKFEISKDKNIVKFRIIGNAFLQHMIRIIVGAMLELHKEKRPPEDIRKILLAKDRSLAGPTYYSKGLCFKKVYYTEEDLKLI
ncbi:MAG TPA: tRNA pseudouridine(38-40) synthase TruA [Spirochaetota bacterium]|nr:tRNA pseudouridine(38-40) synthase TruA [Spirochaetota bacterium]